jgi:hypothetical protein
LLPASQQSWLNQSKFVTCEEIDYAYLRDQVVTTAKARINASEAQILASLGEAKKTVVSLGFILKRLIRIYSDLKHLQVRKFDRRFRDIKRVLRQASIKELSNRYMELRYALRPLAYDIRNFHNAVKALKKRTDRQTFRASKTLSDSSVQYFPRATMTQVSAHYVSRLDQVTSEASREVRVSAGFLTEFQDIDSAQIFGADDLFESAWELVPFSFVVDWFLNVGEKIAAWTPEKGVLILASWLTERTRYVQSTSTSGSVVGIIGDDTNEVISSTHLDRTGGVSKTIIGHNRTPNPGLKILPSFKLRLSTFKILDLTIILTNLIMSMRK